MVRVLVTGAGGYIGFATALALRAHGHIVFGVVRKEADAKKLAANEITPVIGDMNDEKVHQLLEHVSVVIDNVMSFTDNPPLDSNRKLLRALTKASHATVAAGGSAKRYIYTSGVLVYGDHGKTVVDESFPLKAKMPRVAFEQEIIAANSRQFETTIIRPAWVYGGGQSAFCAGWFKGNDKDEIEVSGRPDKQWGWVHIADLAAAYVAVTEAAAGLVAGEAFDVNDDTRLTFAEMRVLLARTNGVKGPVVNVPAGADFFSQLMETPAQTAGFKIRQRLGWQPRMGVLNDNAAAWLAAMKASGVFDRPPQH